MEQILNCSEIISKTLTKFSWEDKIMEDAHCFYPIQQNSKLFQRP